MMELLIVRHGPAGDKKSWRSSGRPDSERPLTTDGRRKARAAARGLTRLLERIDLVAASPWRRALQTAEFLAEEFHAKLAVIPELVPDRSFEDFLAWLKSRREKRIAVVGHEPHLSLLASRLMTGESRSVLRLKKSQALLLEMETLAFGRAELLWSVPPRLLRDD